MKETLARRVRFAGFELDLKAGELRGGSETVRLPEKPFLVLLILVEHGGELVTREEIQKKLWPNDTVVDFEHGINTAIKQLRRVLADSADEPKYIETLPRRGYRLMVPVESDSPSSSTPASEPLRNRSATAGLLGQKVSHYRLLEVIGGGGMGLVYKAEDLRLGRRVALKFLPEELASDAVALQRFEREAQTASSLNHPNICTIYAIEEHEGQPFIAMELLEGETLRDRLAASDGALPLEEMLDIALQVCDGLQAAHERGVIHRDIKPPNIFLTKHGEAKVLDFGLAKLDEPCASSDTPDLEVTAPEDLTAPGVAMGTVAYMSPEQARGEELDARTDIFSLGAVLYEMATGQRAFTGESSVEIGSAILRDEPVSPSQLNPHVSPGMEAIIYKALEKERNLRYQHASDMRTDLQRLKRDSESRRHTAARFSAAAAASSQEAAVSPPKKRWPLIAGAAVVLVAALAGGGLYYRSHQTKPLTDKDTIVIADFDNKTGDAVFDDTLKTALTVALNQSPFLNALPENKVNATLKLMTKPAGTKLTPEIARELCQRADSKAYIVGSIASLGSEYVIGLKAVNCRTDDPLTQEQVTANGKEKVLSAVGDAVAKLRGQLGESLASVQKFDVPLAEATTSSLEALQAYSMGNKMRWEKGWEKGPEASLVYYQRAIQLDPNFAMAYDSIGTAYSLGVEMQRAREYFVRAFDLREHASEREKLLIAGHYYRVVSGELDKSAQVGQELIENYPRDSAGYFYLSKTRGLQGQFEKEVELAREVLQFAPDRVESYDRLMYSLVAWQHFDDARQTIQEALARHLDHFDLHNTLYGLAFLAGDLPAMTEQQQWFAAHPEIQNFGYSLDSDTAAYSGQLSKARNLTKQSVASAVQADVKENGAIFWTNAALREAAFGNLAEARQAAAEGLKLDPVSQAVQVQAALAYAMASDNELARVMAHNINKSYPLDTQVQSVWLPAIQAQLALNQKKPTDAINELQLALPPIEYGELDFGSGLSCLYPTYIRGQAYLAAGQGKEAAAEFQKILDHSGLVWNCWTGALARLGVARVNALQAKNSTGADADLARTRGLAAYRDFLTLWKDADSDIPIYKDAKAEYAKLQ